MTGVGGDTGRGVRVAARGLRTWRHILEFVVIAALVSALIAVGWKWRVTVSAHDWHVMGVYALSEFLLAAGFDPDKPKTIRDLDGREYVASIDYISRFRPFLDVRDRIAGDALDAALKGGGIGCALVLCALAALRAFGHRLGRGRRLRGGELVSARRLARRTAPMRRSLRMLGRTPGEAPYEIARIPWPDGAETLHTIVSGTTGSGKTVLIADLVEQIRERGERCVVYDKMGSYTETFFDGRRDVLLNPLDRRAPRWSPFLEARTARDFDTMAAALIPRQKDAADPFWITAARQLFSHGAAVLWQRGETRNRVLVDHLLKTELSALADAMEGTVAQSIVDPANPKTALSVRAMLTANIGAMDLLPDEGAPFSIREWIERGEPGFLFLTSRGDQHASLRGLISTWLEIAVNTLLSLPRQDGQENSLVRRTWVILDELPTLHQLPSLRPGLAESRQFGGCFVLGVQVFSALRDLYGRDGAETISGLCGTRVVLAAPDKDTSQWSAESLGRVEVETLAEGVSYETPRDGVTLSTRRDLRPLVLPAEVARLRNLSGYIKLPGAWPVARIRLKYRARRKAAKRFEPRGEGHATRHRDEAVDNMGADDAAARPNEKQPNPSPDTDQFGEDAATSDQKPQEGGKAGDGTLAGEDAAGMGKLTRPPADKPCSAAPAIQGELDIPCSPKEGGAEKADDADVPGGDEDGPDDGGTSAGHEDGCKSPGAEEADPSRDDGAKPGPPEVRQGSGESDAAQEREAHGPGERCPSDWQ